MNFIAFRGGVFAKYKIQELKNGEFYARKRFLLFFYEYIDKNFDTWTDPYYIKEYCKCKSIEEAKNVIDNWINRDQKKKDAASLKKTKRFIKYP